MKNAIYIVLALPFAMLSCSESIEQVETEIDLSSDNAKISYALGAQQIEGLIQQQMMKYFDIDAFTKGLNDSYNGDSLAVSMEEAFAILQKSALEPYLPNKEAGEKFLSENALREGVITLPSGLQYEVLTEGTGEKPGLLDQFTAHYTGTLIDGTKFDSSYDHPEGEPLKYGVNQVVPGWTEALQLMSVGSKWKIYLPYQLAYGERGTQGGPIEPYAALIFEMELLGVEKSGAISQ